MKRFLAGGLLAAACFGAQAETEKPETEKPDYFTSQQLYDICSKPGGYNACTYIILGIFQGIDLRGFIDGSDEDCLAYNIADTNDDLKNVIIGYLAANKNIRHTPAATSVVMAVGTEECKAKLGPLH